MILESPVQQTADDLHDSRLKRRLLGTAVLIALAVIFLPLVFDGAGTESQFRSIEPLQMQPPFDLEVLQESAFPDLPDSQLIQFEQDEAIYRLSGEGKGVPRQTQDTDDIGPDGLRNSLSENRPVIATQTRRLQDTNEPESVKPVSQWLIQAASFKDKINALSLRSELKKGAYPVEVKVGETNGQMVFRVFVGPIAGKDEAESVKSRLETKLKRQTLLLEQ